MRKARHLTMLLFVLALVVSACGDDDGGDTTTSSGATTTTPMDFEALSFSAPDCEYGGEFKTIEAVDAYTVRFELCAPDVAFPSKVAFSAFGIQSGRVPRVHRWRWHAGRGSRRHRSVQVGAVGSRQSARAVAPTTTTGATPAEAETLVFRWSSEAAQRLVELQAGTVDGIDNPGRDDFAVIGADADPAVAASARAPTSSTSVSTATCRRSTTRWFARRSAMAHRPAADRRQLLPAGFECRRPVHADAHLRVHRGADLVRLRPRRRPDAAGRGRVRRRVRSHPQLPRRGAQLPAAARRRWRRTSRPSWPRSAITVNIEVMESGAFLDASDAGELTMYLLGWGADYPDATNFLDYHFGAGRFGPVRRAASTDIHDLLAQAAQIADPDDPSRPVRAGDRTASSSTCRWSPWRMVVPVRPTVPTSPTPRRARSATSTSP